MCELGESPLKNKRAFIRPWRVRVVVLKSHDWIDVEGLGILTFKKDNIKKNYSEEFMAVYRDVNPNAQIQKNKEFIPKPKLDESVLLKLRQNYCMEEGECILYSKLEKRKIYTFVSGFINIHIINFYFFSSNILNYMHCTLVCVI